MTYWRLDGNHAWMNEHGNEVFRKNLDRQLVARKKSLAEFCSNLEPNLGVPLARIVESSDLLPGSIFAQKIAMRLGCLSRDLLAVPDATIFIRRHVCWPAERYVLRQRAHSAVHSALKRGLIVKASECEICAARPSRLEAHHDSYDEDRHLVVVWVCRPCHFSLKRNRKLALRARPHPVGRRTIVIGHVAPSTACG